MTGVFRDILSRHFVDPNNIEEPDLRKLIWREGTDTSILIESVHRWRPELTELRPGVIVKRNAVKNDRRGIGDLRQGPHVDEEGNQHYTTLWTGSHTLFCLGGTGAQVELLSTEVQRELTEFAPVILEVLTLKRFQVLEVGSVSILEEAQENFAVPITVGYGYEERWVLRPQVPRLKQISLQMLYDC